MTELISSDNLRKLFFDNFPLLDNNYQVRMSDLFYLLPTYDELKDAVDRHTSKDIRFMTHIGECEEYTCYLRSDIAKERHMDAGNNIIPKDKQYTWALGEADGLLNGQFYENEPHTMNIAITDDRKIWYIENQTATIFKYDLNYFNIYRIWM